MIEKLEKENLLKIEDLSVHFETQRGPLKAVSDASLTITRDQSVALIGESGCGKTTLATSIVDILPLNATISNGRILLAGDNGSKVDLLEISKKDLRKILWKEIAMMFQASQSSFNPVRKIKYDFIDTVKAHDPSKSTEEILARANKLLKLVMLDADRVLESFPHELSGGMKQRALLASALILEPKLIILDEPTTALDLLTQQKILYLLNDLRAEHGFSYFFITHDLGIVSELADVVLTMYAGKIVEKAPVEEFFKNPRHPYSHGLIQAIPKLSLKRVELFSIPGSPPDLVKETTGCPFYPRCKQRLDKCEANMPQMVSDERADHTYACFNPISPKDNGGVIDE